MARPATIGETARIGADALSDAVDGQHGADAHVGIRRADDDASQAGVRESGFDLWRWRGLHSALEAEPGHFRLAAPAHEVLLEREVAFRSFDDGADRLVAHRQNVVLHAKPCSELPRDDGQSLAAVEELPAHQVQSEILVAQLEPGLASEPTDLVHHRPGFR